METATSEGVTATDHAIWKIVDHETHYLATCLGRTRDRRSEVVARSNEGPVRGYPKSVEFTATTLSVEDVPAAMTCRLEVGRD